MRSLLLTGAAFAAIDRRIPNLIAELATESITLKDIQRIISSVVPEAFKPDDSLIQEVIRRLEKNSAGSSDSIENKKRKILCWKKRVKIAVIYFQMIDSIRCALLITQTTWFITHLTTFQSVNLMKVNR